MHDGDPKRDCQVHDGERILRGIVRCMMVRGP